MHPQIKLKTRKFNTGKLERTFTLNRKDMDEEERTIALSFSSETPVDRWFGKEILSHDPSNVRLGRMKNGGAVLVDHDSRDHVGVIKDISIDSDRKGRAIVRFGRSPRADEIFNDVLDEIRTLISVGYSIHKMEEDVDTNTFTATDWEPYELSFVSIPADVNVGVGRSSFDSDIETIITTEERIMDPKPEEVKPTPPIPVVPVVDDTAERKLAIVDARKEEIHRAKEIRALGKEHNCDAVAEKAIDEGVTIEQMRCNVLDCLRDSKPLPKAPIPELGLSDTETQEYSILRALNAQFTGNWKDAEFERECSNEIADRLDRPAQGFYIPCEIQKRVMTVSTDTAGGYLVQEQPGDLIDFLYANTVIGQAGATYLPGLVGDVPIPKVTGASSFYWLGEDEDGTDSQPTLGNVVLMPRTVAGAVPMTRKLMKQSSPAVEQLVMNDLNRGAALAIDKAALIGTGVDGEPLGLLNTTGLSTVTIATAGSPSWVETVNFESTVDSSNALMGNLSWVMTPGVKGNMKTTAKDSGSGIFVMNDTGIANGYSSQTTTQLAANTIAFGDFSSLLIGMWGVMDVVTDTSTKVKSGGLVLRVFQDADIGIRHIESFAKNA